MVVDRSDGDELVQFNVRVPRSLRDKVDARRAQLAEDQGVRLSRDEWTRRVISNALTQVRQQTIPTAGGRSLRRTR